MLLRREFPVRLPGLVHVWHRIRQWRPLASTERLSMFCRIEGHEETDAGAEFCLHTQLLSGDDILWEEQTGFIARAAGRRGPGNRSLAGQPEADGPTREVARLDASSDIGRRYARASGDYNPIHLSAASARPFGFPRAIAHGMWTLARCVAELQSRQPAGATEISVRFRRPVFLPSSLLLEAAEPADGDTAFRLLDTDSGIECLTGRFGVPKGGAGDATG
jgi:acyl dehydratase